MQAIDVIQQLATRLRERHHVLDVSVAAIERAQSSGLLREPPPTERGGDQVRARLESIRDRVAAIVHAVDDRLNAVDTRAAELRTELHAASHDAGAANAEAVERVNGVEVSIEREWAQFVADVARAEHALAAALQHLREDHQTLRQAVESFEHDLSAYVQETARDADSILHRTDRLLGEFSQRLAIFRDRAGVHIRHTFVDEALSAVERASNDLHGALEALDRGAHDGARSVEGAASSVASTIDRVLHVIETIQPVLRMIQAIT
jgi:hypothetical protein